MKILPLTKGLLVSMAQRCDHGFFAPLQIITENFKIGYTNEERIQFLKEMEDWYHKFENNDYVPIEYSPENDTEHRAYEEASGAGFYQPQLEENYAKDYPHENS